jgi:hypothetical protein
VAEDEKLMSEHSASFHTNIRFSVDGVEMTHPDADHVLGTDILEDGDIVRVGETVLQFQKRNVSVAIKGVSVFCEAGELRVTTSPKRALSLGWVFCPFVTKCDYDTIANDLQERRESIARVSSDRRANLWYYSQILRSVAPLAWAAFKRVSGIAAVAEMWRRMR